MKQEISYAELVSFRESGKLTSHAVCELVCMFCEYGVDETAKDQHDNDLPYCVECGVFYEPKWDLREGTLYLEVVPKTVGDARVSADAVPYFYEDSLLAVKEKILFLLDKSGSALSATELSISLSVGGDEKHAALLDLIDSGLVQETESNGVLSYARVVCDPVSDAPVHKDVAASVRHLLKEEQTLSTKELVERIDASRQSIDAALKKLVNTGEIRKVKRGVYETVE